MSDLAEFLLARIAEDEERGSFDPFDPELGQSRLLAECEAKRRIVEECGPYMARMRWADSPAPRVLPLLALPYADHPDYREEWKP